MNCILENFASIIQSRRIPIFKAKPKMYHGLLFLQKTINVLVLNFKAMFCGPRTGQKEGFLYVFGHKTPEVQ